MNRQKIILVMVALLLMGLTAGALRHMKVSQKLGAPGVKTQPLAGSQNLEVVLPEIVLDYTSEHMAEDSNVVSMLPQDTSYGQRRYLAPDGFWTQVNVVLMGSDRTSIHKPQFCLEGGGWRIDAAASGEEMVHLDRPQAFDLPVMKLLTTRQLVNNGETVTVRGIYVYWFVAEDAYTAQHWERMWWMAKELLHTGVLQRWAYVSYFAICLPGQEAATFERMKKLISASVPEFQLLPQAKAQVASVPAAGKPD
jgi:hypothetical protein